MTDNIAGWSWTPESTSSGAGGASSGAGGASGEAGTGSGLASTSGIAGVSGWGIADGATTATGAAVLAREVRVRAAGRAGFSSADSMDEFGVASRATRERDGRADGSAFTLAGALGLLSEVAEVVLDGSISDAAVAAISGVDGSGFATRGDRLRTGLAVGPDEAEVSGEMDAGLLPLLLIASFFRFAMSG